MAPRTIATMKSSPGARDLVLATTIVIGLSRFVEGQLPWVIAALLLGAVMLAGLELIGEVDAAAQTAGIPIESVVLPAVAAAAGVGVIRLVPVGLLVIPGLAVVAWFLTLTLATELRLARSTTPPSAADRTTVLIQGLLAAFGAFAGIAILVPGGVSDAAGGAASPAGVGDLANLALADGFIAFLLGYRIAALRSSNVRDVGWSASMAAGVVATAAVVLRAITIPNVLAAALLVLVLFLWDAIHDGAPARRQDPRRRLETALLVVLGLVVVGWSLGLRG
jgi:hypothetical protein